MSAMHDFEKLGAFYLGKPFDIETRIRADVPLLYDSRDLVTHAVCIGMTGSGKTGLCIGLLEEALIDQIPTLVIDPKGDLTNLLLTFPNLSPAEFLPWVNEDDARRVGRSVEEHAQAEAEKWRQGLAAWGQDAARIRALREAADFAIYTPGSTAGLPVNVLASFGAPAGDVLDEPELLRERLSTTASSLLGLVGIAADPLQSREHILIARILETAWTERRPMDLVALIQAIQSPPFSRVGALDLEAFYPSKDRFALATLINNLLAAPGFDVWMQGDPLDVSRLLHTADGRPRAAVMSIAHLNDAERMFFVSLLLNEVIGWMRHQTGTTSLRAVLYMDEVAGYLPPVANPPSKPPMLTLLKQARAFGVGVVLATQNPVDLDYKALGNIGTWFLGRLQTERDKARLLDGLQGTSAGTSTSRETLDRVLSALGARVFLLHNVHESGPVTFETRWVLSYLRGPLTRTQIRQLREAAAGDGTPGVPAGAARVDSGTAATAARPAPGATSSGVTSEVAAAPMQAPPEATDAPGTGTGHEATPPILPHGIGQRFLPIRQPISAGATIWYEPALYAAASVRVTDPRRQIDDTAQVCVVVPLEDGPVPVSWEQGEAIDVAPADLASEPAPGTSFAPLPGAASGARNYDAWKRALVAWLTATHTLDIRVHPTTKLHAESDESDGDFRIRVQEHLHEQRDAAVEALRKKYGSRLATQQDRVRRAEQAIGRQQDQASQSRMQGMVTAATSVLGVFLGRKVVSATTAGRLGTAARSAGRVQKAQQDVSRARETHEAEVRKLADLEAQLEHDIAHLQARYGEVGSLETLTLRPKRADVTVQTLTLAWAPHVRLADGLAMRVV
jgi:hypothetical protein